MNEIKEIKSEKLCNCMCIFVYVYEENYVEILLLKKSEKLEAT
jgi:hypothetical protein